MVKVFFVTLLLQISVLLLAGCGTSKLYDGPELPDEKVAIVIDKHSSTVFIDQKTRSSWHHKAAVLPGSHEIVCRYTAKGDPWGCATDINHNYSAENDCQRDRQKDIEKTGYSSKNCQSCEFDEYTKTCNVPQYPISCSLQTNLVAGKTYEVSCGGRKTYLTDDRGTYEGYMSLNEVQVNAECITEPSYDLPETSICGSGCYASSSSCY